MTLRVCASTGHALRHAWAECATYTCLPHQPTCALLLRLRGSPARRRGMASTMFCLVTRLRQAWWSAWLIVDARRRHLWRIHTLPCKACTILQHLLPATLRWRIFFLW